MDRLSLKASERTVLGKKVKALRLDGLIPAHVFGKKVETEHVAVKAQEFTKVFAEAGESGLIDLKIGAEKVRPVLVRDVQVDPVRDSLLHIDFYQVNLMEKVRVNVPIVVIGEEPEMVHTGEAVIIQPMGEVEVEALPAELPENIEVDITSLKQIDDTIFISGLKVPDGVELIADPEAVVVKLDNAVSEEAQQLMEEMEQEAEAAAETAEAAEGEEAKEGEAAEGEQSEGGEEEKTTEGGEEKKSSEE
jgi:large subunit ribosomal protein L25